MPLNSTVPPAMLPLSGHRWRRALAHPAFVMVHSVATSHLTVHLKISNQAPPGVAGLTGSTRSMSCTPATSSWRLRSLTVGLQPGTGGQGQVFHVV